MRRILGASAVLAFLVTGSVAGAASAADQTDSKNAEAQPLVSSSIVVNEVSTRGVNGPLDEFIEIRNASNRTIDLTGYTLRVYGASNNVVDTVQVPVATILQPKGNAGQFLVLTGQNFSGTISDQTNTLPFFLNGAEGIPSNGGVAIHNQVGSKLDGVAFSASVTAAREGQPAMPETVTTEQLSASNARDIISTDTDSNRVDFSLHLRTPGEIN